MVPTLTAPLSGVLHQLLTDRSLRERNKELALALVAAGNRGEVNRLTRHWAEPAGPATEALPDGLALTVESVLADGDVVALRATARSAKAAWSLVAELSFDDKGRITRCHDLLVPGTTVS